MDTKPKPRPRLRSARRSAGQVRNEQARRTATERACHGRAARRARRVRLAVRVVGACGVGLLVLCNAAGGVGQRATFAFRDVRGRRTLGSICRTLACGCAGTGTGAGASAGKGGCN